MSGHLESIDKNKNSPKDIDLALSVPGENYFFRLGNTLDNGKFYFNIDASFVSEKAVVQILGSNKDLFKIYIEKDQLPEIHNLEFSNFKINAGMRQKILNRSIGNQIENAYFSLKPDTIKTVDRTNIFDGINKDVYLLDDYKRFKTVPETFVEIIPEARVRRNGDLFEFAVLGKEPYNDFQGSPMVLVDGLDICKM